MPINLSSDSGIPVRLSDIAKAVGVSTMTVSLAMRNVPGISQARRNQIRQVAEAMGYRPNAMAASLSKRRWTTHRHGSTTTLAWLNFWPRPEDLRTHPLFALNWQGAVQTGRVSGL